MKSPGSSAATWQLARHALRRQVGAIVAGFVALLGTLAVDLLAPWPLKIVVDNVLLGRALAPSLAPLAGVLDRGPFFALVALAGAMGLLALLAGVFSYLQSYLASRVGYEVVHTVRSELFARLTRMSLAFHSRIRSGELITRIASDTATIRDVFADWTAKALADALLIVGVLVVMFAMNWRLAALVAVALPLLYVVLRRVNLRIRNSAREQRRLDGELTSRLNESLAAIALVQAFGREAHEAKRFEDESARSRDAGVRNARAAALVSRSVGLVAALATAATVLWGGWLAVGGSLSPGDLLIFLAYVAALFKPVRDLGKLWAKFARARVSAERLGELLVLQPEIRDADDAVDVHELRGEIAFDAVRFGYAPGAPVLDAAHVRIGAGEHVAIIGPSGAGKSTLLRLILRLYEPQAGEVRIDGRPVAQYKLASLRRHVGVVLQDALFVGASVADNVRYGNPAATDSEVERAARIAGLHEFIVGLEHGYATIIGERGGLLSGGQRQRLSLARTLVRDPAIVVLDEPTSAVDPASVAVIEHAIASHRRGRTTLVIGHQFASFDAFDRILEVADGAIIDVTLRCRSGQPRRTPAAGVSG